MFELRIYYDEEKDIFKVSGPIQHPILCYGMLERARDVIKDSITKSAIEVVNSKDAESLLKGKIDGSA